MATRLLRFGSTDLPPSFGLAQDDILRVIEPAKIIRDHGARLITGYAQEKVIPVKDTIRSLD